MRQCAGSAGVVLPLLLLPSSLHKVIGYRYTAKLHILLWLLQRLTGGGVIVTVIVTIVECVACCDCDAPTLTT